MEVRQTAEFRDWLLGLRDHRAAGRITARIRRIELGNGGDAKPVGDGVSEFRIDHGPGYRVYFTLRSQVVVILLCGGDKGSQQRDIAKAKRLAREV